MRWTIPQPASDPLRAPVQLTGRRPKSLQKAKWTELNIPGAAPAEPEPEPAAPATWEDCRAAFSRAMEADQLRPSYVSDALITFDGLRAMFPSVGSPCGVTVELGNEYKRQRSELGLSPWSIKGDLSTLKAVFGKWLGRECGLLTENPFANIKAPKCDEPEIRIVTAAETGELFAWLSKRWSKWRLPASTWKWLPWSAGGQLRLRAWAKMIFWPMGLSGSRPNLENTSLQIWLAAGRIACRSYRHARPDGWAFGRFSDDLRRLLILKGRPAPCGKGPGLRPRAARGLAPG